jgi:hypothetical protein
MEADFANIDWMQPQDLSRSEALACIHGEHHAPSHAGGSHIAMCDGTLRFVRCGIQPSVLASLTSINAGAAYPGVDWPDLPGVREPEFADPSPANELQHTEVWPVADREIDRNTNIIYCCSFQMAWSRARQFANGAAIELEGDPPLAAQLNALPFPDSDLSASCYVAKAGPGHAVVPLIRQELIQKFPKFSPKLLERADDRMFVAYAYLYKDLPFQVSFDRLTRPLLFANAKVDSFGIADVDPGDIRHNQLGAQVRVVDYISDDNFIIRLIPGRGSDEILLAKLPPEKTLVETIRFARERCMNPSGTTGKPELQSGESLVVPVLTVNVDRVYKELLNRTFRTAALRNLYVGDAEQVIRFRLDENGAKVESEAFFVGDNGHEHPPPPPKPRKLILDKPFLIWLREKQASEPYFAAWISNAELMNPMAQ